MRCLALWLVYLVWAIHTLSTAPHLKPEDHIVSHSGNFANGTAVPRSARTTQSAIDKARLIIKEAREAWGAYKRARFSSPRRNVYALRPEHPVDQRVFTSTDGSSVGKVPPEITSEIASAAALLANTHAYKLALNQTKTQHAKRSAPFWMEDIDHIGTQPYGNDPSYKVFRNVVRDFGADPTGRTDSTDAINKAIKDGNRCGANCYSSSTKNAIVYFPKGKYLVSSPIVALYGTQLIGDATDSPTIIASPDFIGLGVITTDVYVGGGKGIDGRDIEYYINTANFYRQIRNFIIDISQSDFDPDGLAALHYQVSQATSLFNVDFICSQAPDTAQMAVFAENGSGGFMSDLTFVGGKYGIFGGNQQFTAHRLTFTNVQTAVRVIWDWGWTWKSVYVIGSKIGFSLLAEKATSPETGSVLIQDSLFEKTETAILLHQPHDQPGMSTTGVTLDNVAFRGVGKAVADNSGKTWLDGVSSVVTWVLGPDYDDYKRQFDFGGRRWQDRIAPNLMGDNPHGLPAPIYFERRRPQYENLPASKFVSVKMLGAKGDGITDDTAVLQSILDRYAGKPFVIYINAGSYRITDTITIPPSTRIVGELWAQLVASGPKFSDEFNPRPMLRVGRKGDVGSVEIQDLLFTTVGATEGLISVEWNLQADAPGSAGLWDCHARIGGAVGSQLTSKECPPKRDGINPGCKAGSLMMHITPDASAYIENMWLWVADHDLDDADLNDANNTMPQLSVYVARGMLIESRRPTWLYGTASEHSTYYQYSIYKAEDVYAGMIQTESPYYAPNPKPPAPFGSLTAPLPGDPSFAFCSPSSPYGCDAAWAVRIERSSRIIISGAGLYSWFNNYDESCVDTRTCQQALIELKDNGDYVYFLNLVTIGARYMMVTKFTINSLEDTTIEASVNEANTAHPRWSHVGWLDVSALGRGPDDPVVYIDPTVWNQAAPTVHCKPPCTMVLPPSTLSSATTISIPLLVTSLEVGWLNNGVFVASTVTTTLSIPAVTTSVIDYSNVHITDPSMRITPTMSVVPKPLTITDVYPSGVTDAPPTRTINLPAYPLSGLGSPSGGPYTTYVYDGKTVYLAPNQSSTTTDHGHIIAFLPTGILLDNWQFIPSPTVRPTTVFGLTFIPTTTRITAFPTNTVSFVTNNVPEPTTTVIDGRVEPVIPCHAWFFYVCTPWTRGIILFGFELPGIYPGGGPPRFPPRPPIPPGIEWPPRIPWPQIIIDPEGKPSYKEMDDGEPKCETATSSVCTTTISRDMAKSTTRTVQTCSPVVGCSVTASATTTTTSACRLSRPTPFMRRRQIDPVADRRECGTWAMIYPRDHKNPVECQRIHNWLQTLGSYVYWSKSDHAAVGTLFWAVERMTDEDITSLKSKFSNGGGDDPRNVRKRWQDEKDDDINKDIGRILISANETVRTDAFLDTTLSLEKIKVSTEKTKLEEMLVVSVPKRYGFNKPGTIAALKGKFYFDELEGNGQTIYALEYGWYKNKELPSSQLEELRPGPMPLVGSQEPFWRWAHGSCVAAKVIGKTVGLARKARVVVTQFDYDNWSDETWVDALRLVLDDIISKGRVKSAIVNFSIASDLIEPNSNEAGWQAIHADRMAIMIRELIKLGVPIVAGAGNTRSPDILGYPARFARKDDRWGKDGGFENMIVVGQRHRDGTYDYGNRKVGPNGVDIYAPSGYIQCPDGKGGMKQTVQPPGDYDGADGSSFAAPQVAAMVAFWRAREPDLTPQQVKYYITKKYARPLYAERGGEDELPLIWNGLGPTCLPGFGSSSSNRVLARSDNSTYIDYSQRMAENILDCSENDQSFESGGFYFSSGNPSPVCNGKGCGKLCNPFLISCSPDSPSKPDFLDPLNPKSPQNPANPSYKPPVIPPSVNLPPVNLPPANLPHTTTPVKPTQRSTTSQSPTQSNGRGSPGSPRMSGKPTDFIGVGGFLLSSFLGHQTPKSVGDGAAVGNRPYRVVETGLPL